MPNYFLTDNDRRLIEEFLREKRNQVTRQVAQPQQDTHASSDLFIVKPRSAAGIPKMASDVPGVAKCDFYRLLDTEAGSPSLEQMDIPPKDVYNLAAHPTREEWTLAQKLRNGKYVVVDLGMIATHMNFTLTAALALTDASSSSATVTDTWGGYPISGPQRVWNRASSTGNYTFEGPIGAKGIAVYHPEDIQWRIIQLEPPAITIKCLTNGAVLYTDANITVDTVSAVAPAGAFAPTVTSVINHLKLPAPTDTVLIAHKIGSEWFGMLPIPWETLDPVTNVTYNSGTKKLQQATTEALVINKATEAAATDIITFVAVSTIMTDFQIDGPNLKFERKNSQLIVISNEGQDASWTTIHTGDPC